MREMIIQRLKEEMVPAVGCTEPAAVALLAAQAKKETRDPVKAVLLTVSSNIYKNAKAVEIPGVERTGVEMAAMLGLAISNPVYNLLILSQKNSADVKRALAMLEQVPFQLKVKHTPQLFIELEVVTDRHHITAQVQDNHENLVFLKKDDQILLDRREEKKEQRDGESLVRYPLRELIETLSSTPLQKLAFLQKGLEMNMEVAQAGLTQKEGLGIGPAWKRLMDQGLIKNDLGSRIARYTSAACDARMAGVKKPVMSVAGSGNHGLMAFIPIAVAAQEWKSSQEELLQALGFSLLLTIYIKHHTGRLSATCGCGIAAGVGAGAGLTYLLGSRRIEEACIMIIASLAGMLCDGGKVSCALKLNMGATMAWRGALLAREGVRLTPGQGIVGENLQETIINLGRVSNQGMKDLDRTIISVLTNG